MWITMNWPQRHLLFIIYSLWIKSIIFLSYWFSLKNEISNWLALFFSIFTYGNVTRDRWPLTICPSIIVCILRIWCALFLSIVFASIHDIITNRIDEFHVCVHHSNWLKINLSISTPFLAFFFCCLRYEVPLFWI